VAIVALVSITVLDFVALIPPGPVDLRL